MEQYFFCFAPSQPAVVYCLLFMIHLLVVQVSTCNQYDNIYVYDYAHFSRLIYSYAFLNV